MEPNTFRIRWIFVFVVTALLLLLSTGAAYALPQNQQISVIDFSQCANTKSPSTSTACTDGWINGILNPNNSHYGEDQSVSQRAAFLVPAGGPKGGRTLTFRFQSRKGGIHAYDSLATWNYTNTTADRCEGIAGCPADYGAVSTFAVPDDPTVVNPFTSLSGVTTDHMLPAGDRLITMYNGTITGFSAYTHSDPTSSTGDEDTAFTITYQIGNGVGNVAADTKVMVLFGGHTSVGTGLRGWGTNLGSSAVSGGPYHFHWDAADGSSIGKRDNQIQGSALSCTSPTVNAGNDATYCETAASVPLSGTASNYDTIFWSIVSGGGSITDPSSLNTTYIPGGADLTGNNSQVTLRLTATGLNGCASVSDDVTFTLQDIPTASAGSPATYCETVSSVPLSGSATNYASVGWSIVSGGGSLSNANSLNATYTPGGTDISGTNSQVTLRLTAVGLNGCASVPSDVVITFQDVPTANAGNDASYCETVSSVSLSGTATNAASVQWSIISGGGSLSNANSLNASYTPGGVDVSGTNATVTLRLTAVGLNGCANATDDVTITFQDAPTANAGNDATYCETVTSVSLSGTATNAASVSWSIVSGGGSLSNASSLNASYTPGGVDISGTNATVTLRLTAVGLNGCANATDDIVITFQDAPTANAGNDATYCETVSSVPLSGTAANYASVSWSVISGGGSLSNASSLNASYTPGGVDISGTNATVTLRLTAVGLNGCADVTDDVTITFQDAPTANAGNDATYCETVSSVPLSGTATNYASVSWSIISGGGSLSNASSLNASYTPGGADISGTNATVTLRLTAVGLNGCADATDDVTITFQDAPTANAGNDATYCETVSSVSLSGTASNYASVAWSIVSGGGSLSNANSLNASYTPGGVDISGTNATVTLRLTAVGLNGCADATDDVTITFQDAPTANAGNDATYCETVSSVSLSGTATNAASVQWSIVSGGGSLSNASSLNASYTPGGVDISGTNATVTLRLTAVGLNGCADATDDVTITFQDAPTANAGNDATYCETVSSVSLSGTASNYASVAWSIVSGGGSLSNANSLNASYTPGGADISGTNATVTLRLTAVGLNGCADATDDVTITFQDAPTADAGKDQSVCSSVPSVSLSGTASNFASVLWTIVSGTGSLSNETSSNASYTPGAGETTATLRFTATGLNGCADAQDDVVITFVSCDEFCTLTQGAWGSTGGAGSVPQMNTLIGSGLTVGSGGTTVTFAAGSGQCVALRLPAGGPASALPAGSITITAPTCSTPSAYLDKKSGKFRNVLLGQTITLTLNMRQDADLGTFHLCSTIVTWGALPGPDGIIGTSDDVPDLDGPDNILGNADDTKTVTIPASVLTALGPNATVADLLALANRALGDVDLVTGFESGVSLSDINAAVDAINRGFDQCRIVQSCSSQIASISALAASDPRIANFALCNRIAMFRDLDRTEERVRAVGPIDATAVVEIPSDVLDVMVNYRLPLTVAGLLQLERWTSMPEMQLPIDSSEVRKALLAVRPLLDLNGFVSTCER